MEYFLLYIQNYIYNKMNSISDEELIKEINKRFNNVIIGEKKIFKLDFNTDIWSEIKSFMGIYNITTDWYKLENVGGIRLNEFYKDNYNMRVTNPASQPQKVREMIYKSIFKNMTLIQANNLYELIKPKDNTIKQKVKIGDEITYNSYDYKTNYYAGIVIKVNKCSVRFKPYKILKEVSDNPNAKREQTFETTKYYWDKNNFDKPMTVRNFTCKDYKHFNADYYEERMDWGY